MERKRGLGTAFFVLAVFLFPALGAGADSYWFYQDFCGCSYTGDMAILCGTSMFGLATNSPETCVTPGGVELRIVPGRGSAAIVPGTDPKTPVGYSDCSLRAQFRKEQCFGEMGFGARWQGGGIGYWGAIAPRETNDDHLFIWRRVAPGVEGHLGYEYTELKACSGDVVLQFDVQGNTLKLWAWNAGEVKPQTAISAVDAEPLTFGGVMVYVFLQEWQRTVYDTGFLRYFAVFPVGEEPFRRGDPNADGTVDMADAIFTLSYLFGAGPEPTCMDAADTNDDGTVDIGDPIALIQHLFGSEMDLAAPVGKCGVDPTPLEGLSCLSYPPCESAQRDCE